jgi:hypothetical protein
LTPPGLARLKLDEGLRCFPYDDATGLPVRASGNVTLAYGLNLSGWPLEDDEAAWLLTTRLAKNWTRHLLPVLPWLPEVNPVWQDVVEMVQYNTGHVLGFPRMLAAMRAGNAEAAAGECAVTDPRLAARYARMANAIVAASWG